MSNAVSFHQHTVWFATAGGERLGIADDVIRLSYTLTQNVPGSLSLVLPASSDAVLRGITNLDTRLYVWRDSRLEGETCWLVRRARFVVDADGRRFWEVTAVSTLELLARRIVPYANATTYATKTGLADNVMKAVVREHLGSSAPTARQLSGLSVQSDLSLGPSITQSFQYLTVLRVCQDLADATKGDDHTAWTYFDIVVTDWQQGALEFRTYVGQRGIDHGCQSEMPIHFSDGAGTLVDAEREHDYHDEITYVYGVREGDPLGTFSAESGDTTRLHASSLNRREGFVQLPVGTATITAAEIAPTLAAGRPRLRFRANIQDLPGLRYGLQWNMGDIVSATLGGVTADCRVDAVTVTVDGGRETIDAALEA
jgi:hypothetical protein